MVVNLKNKLALRAYSKKETFSFYNLRNKYCYCQKKDDTEVWADRKLIRWSTSSKTTIWSHRTICSHWTIWSHCWPIGLTNTPHQNRSSHSKHIQNNNLNTSQSTGFHPNPKLKYNKNNDNTVKYNPPYSSYLQDQLDKHKENIPTTIK